MMDNVEISNQMATDTPVSDAKYQSSLETNYPGNETLKELYRYQGADNMQRRVSSSYSWYAFEKASPSAF